jgi:hypothetical protein
VAVVKIPAGLKSWPLLGAGVAIVTVDVAALATADDTANGLFLMLGIGAVLVGAGLARVVWYDRHTDTHSDTDGDAR